MKKNIFHIHGMHCHACALLTETELKNVPEITQALVSFRKNTVEIQGDFGDKKPEEIVRVLTHLLEPHGYTLSLQKEKQKTKWTDFTIALPLALGFILLFVFLQKLNIVNLLTFSGMTYGTAFFIGLIASVSTCMAVVGGLVLSLSAHFTKKGDTIRPQLLFHIGRILSFFFLGGLIGLLGSFFQFSAIGTFLLSFFVALVLLVLGINLLDIVPWAKKIQIVLPSFFGKRVQRMKNFNHTFVPFLIGSATFFLPCGFTQSMQLYTLTTGNFWMGAFTMLSFALGTFPVLALLSFGSLGIRTRTQSGIFFKTAGLIVIFFGLFNLVNSLVGFGIIPPFFTL